MIHGSTVQSFVSGVPRMHVSTSQICLLCKISPEQEGREQTKVVLSGSPCSEGQSLAFVFVNEPERMLSTLKATPRDVLDYPISH